MIVCHEYKYIFLKNNKCAGSSIEIALSRFCGPEDIITPLTPEEENLRRQSGCRTAQNIQIPPEYYTFSDRLKLLLGKPRPCYTDHMRARELKPRIAPEIWDSYFKFCVVRNPWDRAASLHYYRARDGIRTTLEKSGVRNNRVLHRLNDRGWGLYTIKDEVVVDKFCRYENLAEDLETVRLHLGIPEPLPMPNAKGAYRKTRGRENYAALFNEEDMKRIYKLFRKEIERFDYRF